MADISKITLPSGNTYDIKDAVARQAIAGGIGFVIVWTQSDWASSSAPTAAKLATIPKDVVVHYNSGASSTAGTLVASDATVGNFYLIYSTTQVGSKDVYNEYATVADSGSYFWEKIGDTSVDLTGLVTDVSLDKQTANVIGANSTLTTSTPTITVSITEDDEDGVVWIPDNFNPEIGVLYSYFTGATGDSVNAITTLGTPSTATALTGVKVTTQPSVTLTANASSATGRLKYVEDVTGGSTSPTKTHLSASASGGAVSASGDSVTAVTGVSTAKLATTSITGVSGSTNITPVESRTSQTTNDGTWTSHQGTDSSPDATYNGYILGEVSVANETLSIKGLTLDTQTTYSAGAPRASLAVPTAASAATTVATGGTTSSGSGATVATGSSGTDTVLGTASTFTVTNPSVTIATGSTGDVEVVSDVSDITVSPTYKYMSGSASGTAVGANGTANVVTGYTPTTAEVPKTSATIAAQGTAYNISATSSQPTTSWNSKDQKTVLTNSTDVDVTKGTNTGE